VDTSPSREATVAASQPGARVYTRAPFVVEARGSSGRRKTPSPPAVPRSSGRTGPGSGSSGWPGG